MTLAYSFQAYADLPGAQTSYGTKDSYESSLPNPRNSTNPNGTNCPGIDSISFVGLKFIGQATCVAASNDTRADGLCNAGRHVNPGNPQYGGTGSLTSNNVGYYYCVPDDPRNRKENMCRNLANLYHPYLSFEYRRVGSGTDGNCWCGYNGQMQECNNIQQISQAALASACSGAQNPNVYNRAWTAEQAATEFMNGQVRSLTVAGSDFGMPVDKLYCKCNQNAPEADRDTWVTAPATATSCGNTGATIAAATASGTTTATATQQQEFDRCLADYRQRAMDCQSQANTARDTCREKMERAQNSPLNMAGSMVGALGQVGMAANAGSGNQQNCFGAGVGMMGVREALRAGRESCQSEFANCENTCKQENMDRMLTECPAKLRDPVTNQPMTQAQLIQRGDENAQRFQSSREEFQRMANEGRQICTRDAGGANQDMSRLMNGLGNSLQGSMQCACNFSSANSSTNTNCNQIPTIQSCETDPTLPNCQLYGGLETCTPGSASYNQQQCNCMQNPGSCTTANGTPPPSLFGGNLKNPLNPSGVNGFAGNIAGGGAGGGRGGYDVGSDPAGDAQAMLGRPEFAGGARGGAGGGAGGGGMGAPGGGAGGPTGENPAGVAVQEKGLAGLFNQAKTALAGALGLGKGGPAAKNAAPGRPGAKEDLTKFKPRNLASTGRNGIGTANMDIFGMIKMCAQGETCETNRPKSAWILTP
jgi:hypothetical protein